MKPAWQTPEFWTTLITNVVGILALMGKITPNQASELTINLTQIAGALLALGTAFGYIKGQIEMRKQLASTILALAPPIPYTAVQTQGLNEQEEHQDRHLDYTARLMALYNL